MKDNIHPQYGYVVFRDRSAGKTFLTRSTLVAKAASLPTIEWEDGNTYSCLCSMVLRPVERLVFSPKER